MVAYDEINDFLRTLPLETFGPKVLFFFYCLCCLFGILATALPSWASVSSMDLSFRFWNICVGDVCKSTGDHVKIISSELPLKNLFTTYTSSKGINNLVGEWLYGVGVLMIISVISIFLATFAMLLYFCLKNHRLKLIKWIKSLSSTSSGLVSLAWVFFLVQTLRITTGSISFDSGFIMAIIFNIFTGICSGVSFKILAPDSNNTDSPEPKSTGRYMENGKNAQQYQGHWYPNQNQITERGTYDRSAASSFHQPPVYSVSGGGNYALNANTPKGGQKKGKKKNLSKDYCKGYAEGYQAAMRHLEQQSNEYSDEEIDHNYLSSRQPNYHQNNRAGQYEKNYNNNPYGVPRRY